jgi:CBS domain-containing protein
MDKPISAIMTKSVWCAHTADTIERVEELLRRHRLSCVPVVDSQNAVFGIIRASDLLHFHEGHKNPRLVQAWEMCTYKAVEVDPTTPATEVARLMLQHKVHHVVVSRNKLIKGFVSSLDFVEQFLLKHGELAEIAG